MKYAIILSNLGASSDRYMMSGYREGYDLPALFDRLSDLGQAAGLQQSIGVELVGGWHVTDANMDLLLTQRQKTNIPVVAIIPDHFGTRRWGRGAFTAPDAAIREQAVQETLHMANCGKQLGCDMVSIWNGQDGYDYPMQVDYPQVHQWLRDGIAQVARAMPEVRFALEYKPKEPRNHCFIPNVWSALALCNEIGLPNVGVTMDMGHSLEAYENASEAICASSMRGRLMHVHINDNNRLWDDDMIVGSVHTIEFIELFYWLKRLNYDGYLSIDQYPYREDSKLAAIESLRWMDAFERAAGRIDMARMQRILSEQDAVASTRYMRELLFDK